MTESLQFKILEFLQSGFWKTTPAVILLSVLVASFAIWRQYRTSKNIATIDFITDRERNEFYLAQRARFVDLRDGNPDLLVGYATKDCEERHIIRRQLNEHELMANAVRSGVFREKIVKKFWRGAVLTDFARCEDFIEALNRDQNTDKFYSDLRC